MNARIRPIPKPWYLLIALGLLIAACGASEGEQGSGPVVVATTTILGDVAESVAGSDAEVVVLIPVGADPHDFQPSSAQVATINDADLVIANGLFLEEGLEDVLDAAQGDGVRVIEVGAQLDPIPFGLDDHEVHEEEGHAEGVHEEEGHAEGVHEEEGHAEGVHEAGEHEDGNHEHGSTDPHIWFDPIRMGEAARLIAAQLALVDPEIDWMARADAYAEELAELDEEIVDMLAGIPADRRLLVTNHDSLGYFADRYAFEVVGTVIPSGSTLADPSSEELSQLISTMESEQVNVIFADTTLGTELADAVAAELGERVEVVALYTGSLDEPGSEADTLVGMLRTNADRIVAALSS